MEYNQSMLFCSSRLISQGKCHQNSSLYNVTPLTHARARWISASGPLHVTGLGHVSIAFCHHTINIYNPLSRRASILPWICDDPPSVCSSLDDPTASEPWQPGGVCTPLCHHHLRRTIKLGSYSTLELVITLCADQHKSATVLRPVPVRRRALPLLANGKRQTLSFDSRVRRVGTCLARCRNNNKSRLSRR